MTFKKNYKDLLKEEKKKTSKKSKDQPPTETIDKLILDPSKPDCDGEMMSTKKNYDVYKYRFSNGAAAYFYDTMDEMFKETFKKDIEADFAYFVGLSKSEPVGDDPKGVDWVGLNQGFVEDKWQNKNKTAPPQAYLKVYAKNEDKPNSQLNLREFAFLETTYFTKKASVIFKCEHCLKATREGLGVLFNFLDCNQMGWIDANMIYGGLKNLDVKVKPTTTMVNDFVLKAMEFNTASLDIKDFTYGVLMGLIERHLPDPYTKWDDKQLDIMIAARQQAIDEDRAPQRRRRK